MKTALVVGWLAVACAAGGLVEFYGGDADGRNGLSCEKNGLITGGSWVFDDFDHHGGRITAIWGNFLINYTQLESAHYEIRSGVSEGNGGVLRAAGVLTNPTYIPTGRAAFGFSEHYIKGGVDVSLPAGRYHLSIQPRQTPAGRAFLPTTSAEDLGPPTDPNPKPAGTPLKNGNSYQGEWKKLDLDFSFGVEVADAGQKGDLNCDGNVDFGDVNPFVLALTDPDEYRRQYPDCDLNNADCNGDGKIDFGDINPFVELLSSGA